MLSLFSWAYLCLSKLNVSLKLRRGCVWLAVMLLPRHRAIIWYAFGVVWLNSRGVGLLKRLCFVLECRFAESLHLGLPLFFKAQCLPQIKRRLCLAGCHVVAQTQGYHLVCIWGSLVKFQGGGVVVKTMLCARVQIC